MGLSEHPRGRGQVLGDTTRSLPLLSETAPGPVPALGHMQRHRGSASGKNYNKFKWKPQLQPLKSASKNGLLNAQANLVSLLTSPSFCVCIPYAWPLPASQVLSSTPCIRISASEITQPFPPVRPHCASFNPLGSIFPSVKRDT